MKYFNGIETLEELKKAYRKLCVKNHPDNGGSVEKMAEINAEYTKVFESLKNNSTHTTTEMPEDYINIINRIIHIIDIEIEICGSWIWVSGNTKAHKETLKECNFKWASKKMMWYWRPEDQATIRSRKGGVTMAEIRLKYGSEKVETRSNYIPA